MVAGYFFILIHILWYFFEPKQFCQKTFMIKLHEAFINKIISLFFFILTVISYSSVDLYVFSFGFWSGSIALQYALHHFQNRSVRTSLRDKNRTEKYPVWKQQKAYRMWKLERNDIDQAWLNHSIKTPERRLFIVNSEH